MTLLKSCPTLRQMYESRSVVDDAGMSHELRDYLLPHFAEALYRAVLARRPNRVIEIGMANGASTLAILTALEEIGGAGRLTSIDPYQAGYGNCGLTAVRRAGLAKRHDFIERPSQSVLPELLDAKTQVDLAYIDGDHRVDYVLLDFWFLDKMLPSGGVVAFNDCQLDAVCKVIKFLLAYRHYRELDVGLAPSWVDYSRTRGLIRRLTGASPQTFYRNGSDRYFEKTDNWEPPFSDFSARF